MPRVPVSRAIPTGTGSDEERRTKLRELASAGREPFPAGKATLQRKRRKQTMPGVVLPGAWRSAGQADSGAAAASLWRASFHCRGSNSLMRVFG